MYSRRLFFQVAASAAATALVIRSAWSKTIPLGNSSWLEVRDITGNIVYERGSVRRSAWKGLRLKRIGEGLESGKNSSATLILDQGIGTVYVSEKTKFFIKTLSTTLRGGRITQIHVSQGQVRLKVRPMGNPESRLEIHTPAGVAGVRGTEFGVVVHPSGKTGVATLSGLVDTTAQQHTVTLGEQLQNVTMPGQAPTPAVPLRDSPKIMMRMARREENRVLLEGQTDPVNLLLVDDQLQDTDGEGNFSFSLPVQGQATVRLQIITPLSQKKQYELPIR